LCAIAIDWSGYPSQAFHVLRASLVCEGRSIPLMSQVVPSSRQQHMQVHKAFLNALAAAIPQNKKVIIVTDAGFQSAWFRHVRSLGWDFTGRIRGNVQFRLNCLPEMWLKLKMLKASGKAKYLGAGTLVRAEYGRCEGHFYFHKRAARDRKNQRARCRISRRSQEKAGREAAKAPWLIFSSTDEFSPRKIMKLYSRRMQIEQNFRDEKSERFGFGLRASHSNTAGWLLVLSLLATLVTIVMWLLG
jgi:hypothetical protein